MDFWNDIGKKFSSMARSVTEKTREGVESTRIFTDLRSAKNDLEDLYCEYGKVCFDLTRGEGDESRAQALAERIEAMRERIRELTAQREDIRAAKRCPACGSSQARDARFCSGCGMRLPEESPAIQALPDVQEEFCGGCGALRENAERFCPVCGRDYEAPVKTESPVETMIRAKTNVSDAEEPDRESTME